MTLAVVAAFSYQIGVEQMKDRESELVRETEDLKLVKSELERATVELQATTQTAEVRYRELQDRFEREVPHGILRQLAGLVARRLDEGISAQRVALYITAADEPQNCDEPTSKRFIVRTPTYDGANTSVGFADGRITVTGLGKNAVDANGAPEGWFDPAQDLTINLTAIGGDAREVIGLLPIHTSMVLGNDEYRFTVVEGAQSFVEVTADRCDFIGGSETAGGEAETAAQDG
ncbi:MAG: hypothetical protein AAGF58_11520 [Pseudomonadota bacterium]